MISIRLCQDIFPFLKENPFWKKNLKFWKKENQFFKDDVDSLKKEIDFLRKENETFKEINIFSQNDLTNQNFLKREKEILMNEKLVLKSS